MNSPKKRIEQWFSTVALLAYDRSRLLLALGLALIVFFIFQSFSLTVNTASESLLRASDHKRVTYDAFRDQFGRPELVLIMVESPDIFEPQFLDRLNQFHQALETNVPYLKSVTSLMNTQSLDVHQGRLTVAPLIENWPDTDIAKVRQKVASSKLYQNFILSEDGKTTVVIVETQARVGQDSHFFGALENEQVVRAVQTTVLAFNSPDFKLTASGEPVVEDAFNQSTLKDLRVCVSLSLIMVCVFLALLFKRVSGVFLSMTITVCTLISTVGLMAVSGIEVKITTIVIPAFIVAVSVAASVHILVIFFRQHGTINNKREAIAFAMGHSGLPIAMTSMTTAAGLLSFSFAELAAIAEIGYLSAAGVMLSFFYTVLFLPALIAVLPVTDKVMTVQHPALDRLMKRIALFSTTHPKKIIAVSVLLFGVSIVFMHNLRFSHNLLLFFPEHSDARQDILHIDKTMKGSLSLELLISHPEKQRPDLSMLNRMNGLSQAIKNIEMEGVSVGKVFSMADVIKAANQSYHGGMPTYHMIPQHPKMIAHMIDHIGQVSPSDMERFIHKPTGRTRMTVTTTWADAMVFKVLIDRIDELFKERFDDGYELVVTGLISLLARATHAATMTMVQSYGIAFVVITLMMILMLGTVRLGLISMFPNLLPIVMIMGLMGYLHTPFDMNSLMIGSIAIGLVVDDTVHFMYNFQRYYKKTGQVVTATQTTLLGTGKAMLVTSLVLSAGFFILLTATLGHVSRFGIYTGFVILLALVCDFLLAPALMAVTHRDRTPA